jgi:hypothetical protein
MVAHVKEIFSPSGGLNDTEQTLVNTAYLNAVGARRASLRTISKIERLGFGDGETQATYIRGYCRRLQHELEKVYKSLPFTI